MSTLRDHMDDQLDVLQKLREGDVTDEFIALVQDAIRHNNAMHEILSRSQHSTYPGHALVNDPKGVTA